MLPLLPKRGLLVLVAVPLALLVQRRPSLPVPLALPLSLSSPRLVERGQGQQNWAQFEPLKAQATPRMLAGLDPPDHQHWATTTTSPLPLTTIINTATVTRERKRILPCTPTTIHTNQLLVQYNNLARVCLAQ